MIKNILKSSKALIFDFDGTLFHLFTSFNFDYELSEMKRIYNEFGFTFPDTWNPFEAFKCLDSQNGSYSDKLHVMLEADKLLTNKEIEAAKVNSEVNGAYPLLKYLLDNNIKFSIASNNSKGSIRVYINKYFPNANIPIMGRIPGQYDKLKPNTYMLDKLAMEMGVDIKDCTFFGDHPRDFLCANNAGCKFIGITPAEYKKERMLKVLSEDLILDDLVELLEIIKTL